VRVGCGQANNAAIEEGEEKGPGITRGVVGGDHGVGGGARAEARPRHA
jgi:hypothetical protein